MLRTTLVSALFVAAALVALTACSDTTGKDGSQAAPLEVYDLTGVVIRIQPADKVAVIKHDDIKGWMKAMTMDFPVKSPEDFAKLKPGEKIKAKVYVQDLDFWLADVTVLPQGEGQPPSRSS